MNKLHTTNATFKTERVENDVLKVTIKSGQTAMVYYGDSVDECYRKYKRDRESGMIGDDERN